MVSGRRRLHLVDLVQRLDDLVVHVVDHVAADAGGPLRGLHQDVHGAFGVRPGRNAHHPGDDLLAAGRLQVEQPERVPSVEAVDQVLDVLRRVLRAHETGDRVLQLAAVDRDGGGVREEVVLARVVDVEMGVQDVADVAHLDPVPGERVVQNLLAGLDPAHPEPFHDLDVPVSGVHEDQVRPAGDQVRKGGHPRDPSGVARQHQEARVELDVPDVENLDLHAHASLLEPSRR